MVDKHKILSLSPIDALRAEHQRDLMGKIETERLPRGKVLFRKGDQDRHHVYVLDGTVELVDDQGKVVRRIEGGTGEARFPLAHVKPRTLTARAAGEAEILRIDSDMLDLMLTWDQTGSYQVEELEGDANPDDWMTRLLQTPAFHRIPPANIQALFLRMEEIPAQAGQEIVRQGEEGDYFYILVEGRCEVVRSQGGRPIRLATLGPGDSFGEEALISGAERNATVTMKTPGRLMRLSKEDFDALLKEPMMQRIGYEEAVVKVAREGARFLDVRLPDEYRQGHIRGSENVPLIILRTRVDDLDPKRSYILYCDTGRRSSAGAFLLGERGFEVYILEGGLGSVPSTAMEGSEAVA